MLESDLNEAIRNQKENKKKVERLKPNSQTLMLPKEQHQRLLRK